MDSLSSQSTLRPKTKTTLITSIALSLLLSLCLAVPALADTPVDISNTNIRSDRFTVLWFTAVEESCRINYGTSPSGLTNAAYDDRGQTTSSKAHHVTVTGLLPDTVYYYEVVSGGQTYRNEGSPFTLTTGPVLDPRSGSHVAYGRVLFPPSTPVAGVIVTLKIEDGNQQGTPGTSQTISMLTDSNGWWQVELNSLRMQNAAGYYNYSEYGDREVLSARLNSDAPVLLTIDISQDQGANIILSNSRISGRRIFYNNSVFDSNNSQADIQDDSAIATDKEALLPGRTATFANYTSYSKGINGIMVDVENLPNPANLTTQNLSNYFSFKAGNDNLSQNWTEAPAPSIVNVRQINDTTQRVTLIWNDSAIIKKWLRIDVLANAYTGLTQEDTFYFGNAVGETGNSASDAKVNAFDMLGARDNPRTFLNPAPIDFAYDFNRDKRVNAVDMLITRDNPSSFLDALKLISPESIKGTTLKR